MSIVALDEARDYLNIDTSDTGVNTELQRFIDAADPVVENIVGPVTPATFDEMYDGGLSTIVLCHNPVISITAVTEYSGQTAYPLTVAATPDLTGQYTYELDSEAGILYRTGAGTTAWFPYGRRNVRVQYEAGRSAVPANVKLAAMELIRHLYQSTQQGGRPQFNGAGDDLPWAPAAFAIPTRVIELLEPYRREPRCL